MYKNQALTEPYLFDNKLVWLYNIYMMKTQRKRRSDRNHVIYCIQDVVTKEYYIGLTALCFNGNVRKTLTRRMQKHMQRALKENKNWGLSRALRDRGPERFVFGVLEIVRGKRPAHARETQLIKEYRPMLNTFGVK